jgi:F-box/leucine-rich repeat protein 2/20
MKSLLFSFPRGVKLLSLEGCSLLTVEGLELVILSWKELQRLRVVSCNKIKDSEVTPALAALFSVLKELKWRPDCRSLLQSSLAETGLGKKGGRFFKTFKS